MDRRSFLGIIATGSACCADQPGVDQLSRDAGAPLATRLTVQSRNDDLVRDLKAAAERGGGTVSVGEGVVELSNTLTVGERVSLVIGPAATLRVVANTNAVQVEMGGRVEGGGTIDTSTAAEFSSAAIFLEGTSRWRTASHHTFVGDMRITGAYQPGGTGIHLLASGPGSSVCWVKFSGIDIQRMHTGIKLEATNQSGEGIAWINGNRFDVDLAGVVYGYHLASLDPVRERTNGNWFRSQVQTTPQTRRVVSANGRFNDFKLMVWDWGADRAGYPMAIELGEDSGENTIHAPTLTAAAVRDRGLGNISTLRQPVALRR